MRYVIRTTFNVHWLPTNNILRVHLLQLLGNSSGKIFIDMNISYNQSMKLVGFVISIDSWLFNSEGLIFVCVCVILKFCFHYFVMIVWSTQHKSIMDCVYNYLCTCGCQGDLRWGQLKLPVWGRFCCIHFFYSVVLFLLLWLGRWPSQ